MTTLSKKESQEFYSDALDQNRKKSFQKIKNNQNLSLDEYIQFLNNTQTIFPETDQKPPKKFYPHQKL